MHSLSRSRLQSAGHSLRGDSCYQRQIDFTAPFELFTYVLRKMIESGNLSSFILWGPPGVGKTTLAKIIANQMERPFYQLSAVTSGVKDVREVIEKARQSKFFNLSNPILFIDEIIRFSKSHQDSILGA